MPKLAAPNVDVERRRYARERQTEEVWLFDKGRLVGRARMVERSTGGMKLRGMPGLVSKSDKLLVPSTGKAFDIELVWSVGFDLGLRLRRARRLWGAFSEPEYEPLRSVWLADKPFAD